ncbi:MAG: helix-turn-helix domain-containing protein, partial [Candidatus Thiodiazotropha endolucinida]
LEAFERYEWPGNVRELENILMKSIALSQGDALTRDQLPEPLRMDNEKISSHPREARPLTEQSLEDIERIHVKRVLDATGWHKGQTCEILGISRPRLRRLIRQYDLISDHDIEVDSEMNEDA